MQVNVSKGNDSRFWLFSMSKYFGCLRRMAKLIFKVAMIPLLKSTKVSDYKLTAVEYKCGKIKTRREGEEDSTKRHYEEGV